jgi:hypothetical protein
MPLADPAAWSDRLQRTLAGYDEALLRRVAGRLVKPRSHWPVDDLIGRCVDTATNPAVVDRRLQDLEPAGRQLLALIGRSRQPCWGLGNLVELLIALGHPDGLRPVLDLLEAGLLFPSRIADCGARIEDEPSPAPARGDRMKSFEQWLAFPGPDGLAVFTLPAIADRAIGEDLGLPDLSQNPSAAGANPQSAIRNPQGHESDGLEWLLRLGVLWQQVAATPLRRTQQGGFFKRDAERLGGDSLLSAAPSDHLAAVPDPGFLTVALAEQEGMLRESEGEWRVGPLPAVWDGGLSAALESLWSHLFHLQDWNPQDGWRGGEPASGNPFPSAYLLAFLLLDCLPEGVYLPPAAIEEWLVEHHPYWAGEGVRPSRKQPWVESFLLGVAYHLRLVQAVGGDGARPVRLSLLGRWLLGSAEPPALEGGFPRTLLVQPNLEVVAYRQGLSPALIARLTRFATWKTLGPACTLQLGPETVYRALEAGQTFDSIRLTLEQHGTRPVPPAVLDSLRTWSDKRDRITIYPSATLLEFANADDLNEALARGLPALRLADTLAVVAGDDDIDFRHFRLTGTRDYALPPEQCVTVEPDGITLSVDLARSDLLLETELPRFAERVSTPSANGRRLYRLTPASLKAGGTSAGALETWFQQRTGQPLSAAARLLLSGGQPPAPFLRRHLVLHVASPEIADGLMQWPETQGLIESRLGPTALAVAEENVGQLREKLRTAGIALEG